MFYFPKHTYGSELKKEGWELLDGDQMGVQVIHTF